MLPAVLTFGGGIFVLMSGLAVATPGNVASYLSVDVGAATLLLGFLIALVPGAHRVFGVVVLVLAPFSVPYTYGGLVVGVFLMVVGGVLSVVWVPAPPGRLRSLRFPAARSRP